MEHVYAHPEMNLNISIHDLVTATGIQKALLEDVEAGKRPPIRIPVDKMSELLQRLHLAFDETVDLVESTSENWTVETFRQNPTQLGRVGLDLDSDKQREKVLAGNARDLDNEVQRELSRIGEYVVSLRQQIKAVAPKS